MNSTLQRSNRHRLLLAVALTCVVATALGGCTSRRQYAINESILISERRQLENEIYRVQFELRDALEENEQLRAKLEEEGGDSATTSKKRRASARSQNTESPVNERPQTTDESMFPGGDALRANTNSYNDRYPEYPTLDMNEISKLPDFAVVPDQRAPKQNGGASNASKVRQAAYAQPQGPSNAASQVSYEDVATDEYEEEEEYDESADDEDDPGVEDSEYEEEMEEEDLETVEEEGEWSPMSE